MYTFFHFCSFTAKALALLISQVTGNMVHFRIISPIRLKDLSITFKKVGCKKSRGQGGQHSQLLTRKQEGMQSQLKSELWCGASHCQTLFCVGIF